MGYTRKMLQTARFELMRNASICLVSLLLAGMVSSSKAATWSVPSQIPSIQAAVDTSANGDTILVAPGTYAESIEIEGGAIHIYGPDVRIEDNVFEDNEAYVDYSIGVGSGVYARNFATNIVIRRNLFLRNVSGYAVIALESVSNALIEENTLALNESYQIEPNRPAGIRVRNSSCTIANNIVALGVNGWGIHVSGNSSATLNCNDFWGNELGSYAGITPGPTDFSANPNFCNLGLGDLTLDASSPCLAVNNPGCGQVGAFSKGCAEAVGIQPEGRVPDQSFVVRMSKPGEAIFSFANPEEWAGVPIRISIFTVEGARVFDKMDSVLPAVSSHRLRIGRKLSSGVYFLQLTSASRSATAKVVLIE